MTQEKEMTDQKAGEDLDSGRDFEFLRTREMTEAVVSQPFLIQGLNLFADDSLQRARERLTQVESQIRQQQDMGDFLSRLNPDLKCLFDEVLEFKKVHGLYRSDNGCDHAYTPWFDRALKMAHRLDIKSVYSRDSSHFGQMFRSTDCDRILTELEKELPKKVKPKRPEV